MFPHRLFHIQTVFVLLGLLWQFCQPAQAEKPAFHAPLTVQIEKHQYRAAVASTPAEQERGLMYQTHLPQRTGMLFPLEKSRQVAFWMKNTLIPLDMLFIQNNRLVQIVHDAQPCKADPCMVYTSNDTVDTVLELPGGTAERDRLKPGSTVQVLWLR